MGMANGLPILKQIHDRGNLICKWLNQGVLREDQTVETTKNYEPAFRAAVQVSNDSTSFKSSVRLDDTHDISQPRQPGICFAQIEI
jgi:hypothetical protein